MMIRRRRPMWATLCILGIAFLFFGGFAAFSVKVVDPTPLYALFGIGAVLLLAGILLRLLRVYS